MTTGDSTTGTQGAAAEKTVIAQVRGSVGFLELNRPKSLNSLDTEMCQIIHDALDEWREDDAVSGVVIYSNNPKAFCAGGDVRVIREAILDGQPEVGDRFLDVEYSMNAAVVDFPKPYIALIDGIVMGGGLGVSVHGSRRVVSERSWASMPEMAIGFCPDVGVTYAFQRMVNATGSHSFPLAKFLVLTTWRLSPQDMMWSGLATDYVPSDKFEQLREALESAADADGMNAVIDSFAEPLEGESQLAELMEHIETVFDAASWEEVVTQLQECPSEEFRDLVRGHLSQANPASLVATMELMDANERVDNVQAALANEFAVGKVLREDKNFVEGVRAVLVDKGRDAVFDPATTAEVDVEKYRAVVK
ncbi:MULTISPECIES: 3-hydroxyisobutyryl-CoA hydrolase [Corynebacterium]|uniref:3-hydroxyisobutyryl-CoA hydrolase n=1 Tax=Corynebacterium TaxID=1716 RepID=UPI00124DC6A1|nr:MULTISPECIES: 3-hydroxyisobutyryl-CoA hydrolase [Corynebacterium]